MILIIKKKMLMRVFMALVKILIKKNLWEKKKN